MTLAKYVAEFAVDIAYGSFITADGFGEIRYFQLRRGEHGPVTTECKGPYPGAALVSNYGWLRIEGVIYRCRMNSRHGAPLMLTEWKGK